MSGKEQSEPLYKSLSSKIKNIYIELHDYSFFHGPSEIRNIDKRFIGRKNIINKLRAILTNNENRSGAYLVTGYRGMGKSSYVSKVIEEIDPSNRRSILATRYVQIIAFSLFLSLIRTPRDSFTLLLFFLLLPIFITCISLYHLFKSDKVQNDLSLCQSDKRLIKKSFTFTSRFKRAFFLIRETDSENTYRKIIQLFFIFSLINLLVLLIDLHFTIGHFFSRFLAYFLSFTVYRILNYVDELIENKRNSSKLQDPISGTSFSNPIYAKIRRLKRKTKFIIDTIKLRMRNYFNYSKRIYIRLNLGYDELKEIDILRLISKNIEKEYRNVKRIRLTDIFFMIFKFLFVFIIAGIIYYSPPIYEVNQNLKIQTGIISFLPSQNENVLENKEILSFNKIRELLNNQKETIPPPTKITVKVKIQLLIQTIDYQIYYLYKKLINDLHLPNINLSNLLIIERGKNNFRFFPSNFDYLLLLYFLTTLLCIKLMGKIFVYLLGGVSHTTILKKMKELNDMIDFQITDEKGGTPIIRPEFLTNPFRKKTKTHNKADIREIEKRLLEILEDFDKLGRFAIKPEFICIFDELDKIEPHENISIEQKEDERYQATAQPETTYFATEGVRRRQHTIFKILSNLKHFLNTAQAKFIFIAGRELYDAALADVSDRNFFIGSIFHDVIYVNSFLTDNTDNKVSNITSMTEQYICQFLFPPNYNPRKYSLKFYKEYLDEFFDYNPKDLQQWEKKEKINKIIFTLRNFITFLTYRSNGAPKKLTNYFENYIYKPIDKDKDPILTSNHNLRVGFSSRNLYLQFRYYEQYTFGMMSYLVQPIVLAVSKSIKDFGDKLLVSTSFLVDHLFKFHKTAFSWRNIELTPEIVDINKAPQLRELLSLIIYNLSNTHIMEIVNGLYDLKFRKKISEEISFLSKISEMEAAAFNFTLDESLSKRHHKKILAELKQSYKNTGNSEPNKHFINSVAFIHMMIGDLHFYDEEYNDAIVEYMEATETLRNIKFDEKSSSFFILLVRNMLKLGYALEKRKTYTSAFIIYGQLVSFIVNYRDIDLNLLGLKQKRIDKEQLERLVKEELLLVPLDNNFNYESIDKDCGILVKDDEFQLSSAVNFQSSTVYGAKSKNIRYDEEIRFDIFDPQKDEPVCLTEDLGRLVTEKRPYTTLKESLSLKISSFEGIRLITQPLVAKFQMIEKANLGGIGLSDLKTLENEFDFITRALNHKEKFLISAEFWCKIADILYFKNGLPPKHINPENQEKNNPDVNYCSRDDSLCSQNPVIESEIENKGYSIPCRSCHYYMKALQQLSRDFLNIEKKDLTPSSMFPYIFYLIRKRTIKSKQTVALEVIANTLSGIGNNFFSCCTTIIQFSFNFLSNFLDLINNPIKHFLIFFSKDGEEIENDVSLSDNHLYQVLANSRPFNKLEEVFVCYYLSYLFYMSIGQHREAAVQMLKILYVIRNLLHSNQEEYKSIIIPNLDKILNVFDKNIKNLYRAYDNIHRLEIEDFKDIFNIAPTDNIRINLNNISLSADFREIIFVLREIELICEKEEIKTNQRKLLEYWNVTPYYSFNRMYNRIIDLKFKTMVNYKIFEELKFREIFKGLPGDRELSNDNQYLLQNQINDLNLDNALIEPFIKKNNINTDAIIDFIEFLIVDSIFCLHEIIKLINISGITYMVNYSILASTHFHMGEWCDFYYKYLYNSPNDRRKSIRNSLSERIGEDNLQFLSQRFHYEKARAAYYSIYEVHNQGKAYKDLIEKMFYLNDDYNETIYHFHAAAERFRINSGHNAKKIRKLKELTKESSIYDYQKYISTPWQSKPSEIKFMGHGIARFYGYRKP